MNMYELLGRTCVEVFGQILVLIVAIVILNKCGVF